MSKGTDVLALELFGHELALNVVAPSRNAGICGRREIRLLHLGAKRARVLGTQICGLNGQVFWGPTFDAGRLYFTRSCNTNCGTTRYGAYRYRNGHYEIAGDNHPLQDWAWGGDGSVYQLRGTDGAGCSDPDVECTLVWTDGLKFKPVGGPIHP